MAFTIEQLREMRKGITKGKWFVAGGVVFVNERDFLEKELDEEICSVKNRRDEDLLAAAPLLLDQLISMMSVEEAVEQERKKCESDILEILDGEK